MNALLRIALLCALIASAIGWVGGSSPAAAQNAAYTDTMDSEATGLLGTASPDPAQASFAYQDGTFVMQALDPAYEGELLASILTPVMGGTQVLFDVSVSGDVGGKYVIAGCRAGPGNGGYQLEVNLDTGEASLRRMHREFPTGIASTEEPVPLNTGATMNQIGIECQDNRISGIVNGVTVLTTFDPEYTEGHSYIGVGSWLASSDGLTAAFDNLTVADLGSSGFDGQTGDGHALDVGNAPQPLSAPPYDPEAAYVQSAITSVLTPPTAGPIRRTGPVAPNQAANVPLGVQLDELYAELTFVTPQPSPLGLWLFGFCFWVDPSGSCTDFFIQSNGAAAHWGLGSYSATGEYTLLDWGDMPAGSVDLTPGAENVLAVVVYQGSAVLGANGQVAASFFLSSQPVAGDVVERVEYSNDGPGAEPLIMTATDVAVWDLSDVGLVVDDETPEDAPAGTQGAQSILDRTCRYGMPVKSSDSDCGATTSA